MATRLMNINNTKGFERKFSRISGQEGGGFRTTLSKGLKDFRKVLELLLEGLRARQNKLAHCLTW